MKTFTNRALIAAAVLAATAFIVGYGRQQQDSGGKYAEVNGLKMYYEIHGSGRPLVLLHGAFGFAEGWGAFLPTLTKTHQVIAEENHASKRSTRSRLDKEALGRNHHQRPAGAVPAF